MSEPIYEQVLNDKLQNELYQNVERFRQVTREVERLYEEIREAKRELLGFEIERKALMEAIHHVVESINLTIDEESFEEESH